MIASPHPAGRPTPAARPSVVKGLLPMTLVALALTAALTWMHAQALGAEAQGVARIQAVRLAGSISGTVGDDALRDALTRTLSRSTPTQRVVLHRNDTVDLIVRSGRPGSDGDGLHVRLNAPAGELETISDASALQESRAAAAFLCLLLCSGIGGVFVISRNRLERDILPAAPDESLNLASIATRDIEQEPIPGAVRVVRPLRAN